MNQARNRTAGNTLFIRIVFPGHVIRPLTVSCIVMQFARESFGICRFRGSCERMRLKACLHGGGEPQVGEVTL